MEDTKSLVTKFFEIIDYQGDKEKYAIYFTNLIMEESVFLLIQSLPPERRVKIAKKSDKNATNPAAIASLINHYFSPQQIMDATKKAAGKAMQDYMQILEGKLSDSQKEKLIKLSEEYKIGDIVTTKKNDTTYRRMF